MDPLTLAGTVVANLLLPYAKLGFEGLAEQLAQTAGGKAAQHVAGVADKAWQRVKAAFGAEGKESVLDELEKHPAEAGGLVETMLAEVLERDEELKRELEELVSESGPDGESSVQVIASSDIQVVATGANIYGGVIIGKKVESAPAYSPRPPSYPPPRPSSER